MALDASIPLQYRGAQIEPQENALARILQLKSLQQQNALARAQFEDLSAGRALQRQKLENALAAQGRLQNYLQALAGGAAFNPAEAAAAGVDEKMLPLLAQGTNLGRPKVARTIERAGPNGMPEVVQADEFGGIVGNPFAKPVENKLADLGGSLQPYNPFSQLPTMAKTNSPDALLSASTARRGQDMADARSREANALQKEAQRTQIIDTPNGPVLADKGTGQGRPVIMNGAVVPGDAQMKRESGAKQVLALLDQAEPLIDKATGSYAGSLADQGARLVGGSPAGADAIAQLRTIEGALLGQMPRMEGPQSNYDVQLYKQAAGALGDPTVPKSQKKAALKTIREIQQRYVGAPAQQTTQRTVVRTGTLNGRKVVQYSDGSTEYAD